MQPSIMVCNTVLTQSRAVVVQMISGNNQLSFCHSRKPFFLTGSALAASHYVYVCKPGSFFQHFCQNSLRRKLTKSQNSTQFLAKTTTI